ncbi:hypothetical protein FQN54_002471 [Arachnomyces sp. PD_36]|nr:hypothetical protein FQN54_002471 [Arachnomyces sp. PD_36]
MGVWDYHCAICAASIKGPAACSIGSPSEPSLQRRRELIREGLREKGLEDGVRGNKNLQEIGEEEGSEEAPGEEKGDTGGEEGREGEEEEEEEDDDSDTSSDKSGYENITYDPSLLSRKDLRWLEPPYCIGVNPDAPGEDNYGGDTVDNLLVYPFHWCCLEILALAITGSAEPSELDKVLLHAVMDGFSNGDRRLTLDHGDITGAQQFWSSEPGEEYSVCNPVYIRGFDKVLHRKFLKYFRKPDPAQRTNKPDGKVVNDPFSALPYDILHLILELLPGKSIQQLVKASWPANCALGADAFWKKLLHSEFPWFWELHELLDDLPATESFDFKKIYFWLDEVTTPVFGMRGRVMRLANRRRIWHACGQLAEDYLRRGGRSGSQAETTTEDASVAE